MSDYLLSKRYAHALFDLAVEFKKTEEAKKDMEFIRQTLHESRDLKAFLKSPLIKPDKKVKAVNAIFKDQVDLLTIRFLALVIKQRREALLENIAIEFIEIYKEYNNIITIEMTTAAEISKETREMILKVLGELRNANIELIEKTDSSLIGGFVLRMGDKQYDSSLRASLKKLKKEFEENLYERKF